jgi:hypothetical protein
LKEATPSWVLEGWKAAYSVEPWGDDWWQTGVIASAAVNPHIKRSLAPSEFMPRTKRSAGITDVDEMEAALRAWCGSVE